MVEEKATWCSIQSNEIPARDDSESSDTPLINRIISSSREVFYDFSVLRSLKNEPFQRKRLPHRF